MSRTVGDSSPLTGRVESLGELIRSICNTPTEMTNGWVLSVGHAMTSACFVFNSARQTFTISASQIGDQSDYPVEDIRPLDFIYKNWCSDMEILQLNSLYDVYKSLSPLPLLRYLHASISSSHGASHEKMRDELDGFITTLPPTLEVLQIMYYWERPSDQVIPLRMHNEIDKLLATIPNIRCPIIKALGVDLAYVSNLFNTTRPLTQLITSCERKGVPLAVWEMQQEELRHIFEFTEYLY